jgi:hypothetical protein
MKSFVLWVAAPCGQVQVNQRHLGTYLHLQGGKISQANSACCLLHAYLLHGLFLGSENEDDIFLRNVDRFSGKHMTSKLTI